MTLSDRVAAGPASRELDAFTKWRLLVCFPSMLPGAWLGGWIGSQITGVPLSAADWPLALIAAGCSTILYGAISE